MTAKAQQPRKTSTSTSATRAGGSDFSLSSWLGRGLCCPTCLGTSLCLHTAGARKAIICEGCDGVFPVLHGSPHMVDVRTLLELPAADFNAYERAQINATPEYRTVSPASVALSSRDDVRQVMQNLKIRDASVLDVGSGVFTPPEYLMEGAAAEIIGVDPMPPESTPQFQLVGAFAEFLPFAAKLFDVVTAITSTDHFIDLDNALREIRRVLKPGGVFYVWHEFTANSEMTKPAGPVQTLPRRPALPGTGKARSALAAFALNEEKLAARRAGVPKNWQETVLVDPFHAQHLGYHDFLQRLAENGLALVEEVPIHYPNGGVNSFMVIRRQVDVQVQPAAAKETASADEMIARVAGLLDSGFHANATGMVGEMRALLDHQRREMESSIKTSVELVKVQDNWLKTAVQSGIDVGMANLAANLQDLAQRQLQMENQVADLAALVASETSAREKQVSTDELRDLIESRANRNDVKALIESRPSLDDVKTLIESRASVEDVKAVIESRPSLDDVKSLVQSHATLSDVKSLLADLQQADANRPAPVFPDNRQELQDIANRLEQQRMFSTDQGIYLETVIGNVNATMQQQFLNLHERLENMQAVQAQMRLESDTLSRIKRLIKRVGRLILWPFTPLILLVSFLARPFVRVARGIRRVLGYAFSKEHSLLRSSMLKSLFRPAPRTRPERRRILMLTISMIEIDPRINKIAKSLVEAGWEVDILCQQPTVVDEFLTFEQAAPGIRYIRVKWAPEYMRHWLYYQHIFLRAARELDFEYVHVNDMTTLLVGWLISRTRGKPLIYDAHEMWSENVEWDGTNYVGMPKKTRTIARLFEGFMLRYIDSFYSVSPSILVEYKRRHGREPKMLANFPDIPTLDKDVSAVPSVRELAGIPDDKFVTIYLGGLGPARNIEAVIDAHKYLDDRFIFLIRGPDAHIWGEKNLEYARSVGVDGRIRVLPGVGRDDIMAGMKGADCGIVMLRNLCNNFYWFYPNKFFEYAMGGIPVVVSNFPDVTAHIEHVKNGITVDPHNPEDIARGLRWLAEHPEEKLEMGRRGRESILREYNWHTAIKVMVEDYDQLWKKGRGET